MVELFSLAALWGIPLAPTRGPGRCALSRPSIPPQQPPAVAVGLKNNSTLSGRVIF